MALCLIFMRNAFLDLNQICSLHVSWCHPCSMLCWFTKDAKYKGTWHQSLLLILNHWVSESWILMVVANLQCNKIIWEASKSVKLCPPTYFQQKKRTVSDPSRLLARFSSLHLVWGRSPAILNHGCPASLPIPRLKTTQTKQSATYRDPGGCEKETKVAGVSTDTGGKFAFWFFRGI